MAHVRGIGRLRCRGQRGSQPAVGATTASATNDPGAARSYHQQTKHSLDSVRANPHRLLWEIQPIPFKLYEGRESLALPRDLARIELGTLAALTRPPPDAERPCSPSLGELARLLYLSAGITRERSYADGRKVYFRAAACTGALYHIDLYLVCGPLEGLAAGVYHFGPHDFSLTCLRAGDYRRAVVDATAEEPSIAKAPAILVCASTYWRNSWKYQARAYRHAYWDSGTLLANLLAVARASDTPARVVMGFVDDAVNALLGLDTAREAALALVGIGHDPRADPPPVGEVPPLKLPTQPLSAREVDYSAIREMHAASSLPDAGSVASWRRALADHDDAPAGARAKGDGIVLPLPGTIDERALDQTIQRRGSTRQFAHAPIGCDQLSAMLLAATEPVAFDFRDRTADGLDDVYLIANALDGIAEGSYALLPQRGDAPGARLESLAEGSFRREAGYLGLGQELAADAAVDVYFLSPLDWVLTRLGARGYRAAQLESAIHGGRLYLAAYALGLGATGLTFFDDDVTSFFSPHAADKAVMFLVAVGRPVRGRRARG